MLQKIRFNFFYNISAREFFILVHLVLTVLKRTWAHDVGEFSLLYLLHRPYEMSSLIVRAHWPNLTFWKNREVDGRIAIRVLTDVFYSCRRVCVRSLITLLPVYRLLYFHFWSSIAFRPGDVIFGSIVLWDRNADKYFKMAASETPVFAIPVRCG